MIAAFDGVAWNADALKAAARAGDGDVRLKLGKAQAPVRVAVTGRSVGPPLFESLEVLGRDETSAPAPARQERVGSPADGG